MVLTSKLRKPIYYYISLSEAFYTVTLSNDFLQNKKKTNIEIS